MHRYGCIFRYIYLKTDVLLLAAVFETFRKKSFQTYKLEICHYLTISSYAWDAMLLSTKVSLELIASADMYEFFNTGIRGGIRVCNKKCAVANNQDMKNFDPEKPSKYIQSYDANNLYPFAMSHSMPQSEFEFLNSSIFDAEFQKAMKAPTDSKKGWVFEVDITIPLFTKKQVHCLLHEFKTSDRSWIQSRQNSSLFQKLFQKLL